MSSSTDTVALHGWTAVPRDAKVILDGKPYINKPDSLLVKDIKFPSDDPVVAKVREYAQDKLSPQTFNHSMRVYYFCKPPCHKNSPVPLLTFLKQWQSLRSNSPPTPPPSPPQP
jgi:cyanamide hydratase